MPYKGGLLVLVLLISADRTSEPVLIVSKRKAFPKDSKVYSFPTLGSQFLRVRGGSGGSRSDGFGSDDLLSFQERRHLKTHMVR